MTFFLLVFAAAAQAAGPAEPDELRYKRCVEQIRAAPATAAAEAEAWRAKGGGLPARLCLGLAQSAQQRWTEAAATFEAGATEADKVQDAASLRVQAGNAWLAAGEAAKARKAFDSALASAALAGELRGEVHLDRARAAVALGDLAAARTDIDEGLRLVPGDPFAWYLSAALARRDADLERAQDHIAKAVELAPDDAAILVEAGNIAGVSGETEAAQGLYARAIRVQPGSEAAKAARAALAAAGVAPAQSR